MTSPRRCRGRVAILAIWLVVAAGAMPEMELWPLKDRADALAAESLEPALEALRPLFNRLDKPAPNSWRYQHREAGQLVADYRMETLVRPGQEFSTIYIQPLGDFNPTHQRLLVFTAEYLNRWFQMPVRMLPAIKRSEIPAEGQRTHPQRGETQLLTTWLLQELLPARRPKDALALWAISPFDLWAGESNDFLFAHTDLRERVGVMSIARLGDPTISAESFRSVLRQSMSTASHELGHILNLKHCLSYACAMNGAASHAEALERSLQLCPLCLAKILWSAQADPLKRVRDLLAFCEEQGLMDDAEFYRACLARLSS